MIINLLNTFSKKILKENKRKKLNKNKIEFIHLLQKNNVTYNFVKASILSKDKIDNNSFKEELILNKLNNYYFYNDLTLKNKSKIYLFQFIFSIIIIIFLSIILIFSFYKKNTNEAISQDLLDSIINTSENRNNIKNNNILNINTNSNNKNDNSISKLSPFVIGIISIDKIRLTYPILSQTNSELLKISPCKLCGPNPNEVGNLCIAGHNYVDYRLFSRLHELEQNDNIIIYDLNGTKKIYTINSIYEVDKNDLSPLQQSNNITITLITCNNVTNTRLIIKATVV